MNLYLASPYANASTVKFWIARLREKGVVITHDWTPSDDPHTHLPELELAIVRQHEIASEDLKGVDDAEVVWVISAPTGGTGCWIEMGYAFARGKLVVLSGPRRTIFTSRADCVFESHEAAFEHILSMLKD